MPRFVFMFPGQGAQFVGMARELCEREAAAKSLFDRAAEILGYDLLKICVEGPADRLNSTEISQPALYVASLAALESLKKSDAAAIENCAATGGLSLGEYTALTFAGALSFDDGLRVVQRRGQAMQAAADATPSGMVAVIGPPAAEIEALCGQAQSAGLIKVANYLCPGNTVVSGTNVGCESLEKLAADKGFKTVRLSVAGAFHTEIMKPADDRLREALESVTIRPPKIPVWSNVDAQPHSDPHEINSLLVQQVLMPVRWEEQMRAWHSTGVDRWYEVGRGRSWPGC